MTPPTDAARRLHPYTAVVRGLSRAGSLGTLATILTVAQDASLRELQTNLGLIGGVILLGVGYEFLYYQRFEYRLTDDSFDIDSGVLSRREREIPLGRIQNIDISQSPVARLLGLAVLELETAGGGSTEARLRFVDPEEARRLQRELQSRKGDEVAVDEAAESADREPLYELGDRELWLLSLTSLDPGASVIVSFLGVMFQLLLPTEPGEGASQLPIDARTLEPIDVAGFLVALVVLAWLVSVALVYSRYANFRLYRVGDELRYERGLLGRYSGTIPLGKVQTASLVANPLKRRFGYATLSLETAGYAPGSDDGRAAETAMPLAKRDRALAFVAELEQFDGIDPELERPPIRARRRYAARYTLVVAALVAASYGADRLFGLGPWYLPALLVLAVPAGAHLKWANRGHRTTDRTFVARTGYWRRTTRAVPFHRLQTVVDTRSIFQRRRHLASVTADTASTASVLGGDATAFDVDADHADDLREHLARLLQDGLAERRRARRAAATSPSWAGPAATTPADDAPELDRTPESDGTSEDDPQPDAGPGDGTGRDDL
jgi:putative membrane protein